MKAEKRNLEGQIEKAQKKLQEKDEELKTIKNQATLVEQSLDKDRDLKGRELKDTYENLRKSKAEAVKLKSELGLANE